MPLYTCDPAIELNGQTTNAFLSSLLTDEYMPVLEKHGFTHIDIEQWYPLHKVLAVVQEIHDGNNSMSRLISLGMAAANNIELPPEVLALSPIEFLKLYEKLYPTRHRNGEPGTVQVTVVDANTALITLGSDVPYPDDLMYGVFYAYAQRLTPRDSHSMLKYIENGQPRREFGGTQTVIQASVSAD
jgi:hypothetical protein